MDKKAVLERERHGGEADERGEGIRVWVAGLGFLAVGLGAFGAHGLKETLLERDTAMIWRTAVDYHFYHTLVLLWITGFWPRYRWPASFFFIGILLFSGSLYGLALVSWKGLGPVTPLGGLCFLAGWAGLGWESLSNKKKER